MTPAATPEALAENLRKSLAMAANDPGNVLRADGTKVGYKGDRCMGGWIADAILAGPLAPLLAALQQATAERDEAIGLRARVKFLETEWSEATDRHEAAVREQHHLEEKLDAQRRARRSTEAALATATAEAASLRAEVEARGRALASLADNETLLLRAANLIDCGTAKHCEYFFHSKRVSGRFVPAQCARETEEGRGCLADDATSLRILSGKLREATALARVATAGEG